jgi:hypothetical protein
MAKDIYTRNGKVNLQKYDATLLHKDSVDKEFKARAVILFNSKDKMNQFIEDWALDNDCILYNNFDLLILAVPICLVMSTRELERILDQAV